MTTCLQWYTRPLLFSFKLIFLLDHVHFPTLPCLIEKFAYVTKDYEQNEFNKHFGEKKQKIKIACQQKNKFFPNIEKFTYKQEVLALSFVLILLLFLFTGNRCQHFKKKSLFLNTCFLLPLFHNIADHIIFILYVNFFFGFIFACLAPIFLVQIQMNLEW